MRIGSLPLFALTAGAPAPPPPPPGWTPPPAPGWAPPPPQPYAPQGSAPLGYAPPGFAPPAYLPPPAAAPPVDEENYQTMVLGLIGGVLVLFGAMMSWVAIQSCVNGFGTSFCITVPIPPTFAISSIDSILAIAPLIAIILGLVGLLLSLLRNQAAAMAAGTSGVIALVFVFLYVSRLAVLNDALHSIGGGGTVTVQAAPGIGLWVSMIGGVMLAAGGFTQMRTLKARAALAAAAHAAVAVPPLAPPPSPPTPP